MTSIYNPDREGFTYKPHGRCRFCNTPLAELEGYCRTAFSMGQVVRSFCKTCHENRFCDCNHPWTCKCDACWVSL